MRNRTLHGLLQAFAQEASTQLSADAASGAEVPFELVEERGRHTPLYCYRALTGSFIRERLGVLGRLPSYAPAARALEGLDGVAAYLHARGEQRVGPSRRDQADAALRILLSVAFEDSDGFELSPERFARAYSELESAVYAGRALYTVVAPVLGLELDSPEVPMGDGLVLMRGDALPDAPPEAAWPEGSGVEPAVLAVFCAERAGDDASPVAVARVRFRELLRSLRLFEPESFGIGPAAFARIDAGPWRVVRMASAEGVRGGRIRITPAQEDELRAFGNLIGNRAPRGGELAWALRRFEMGCERGLPLEALSDHLLALRALLEPEGPASGRLARRLAAICALPEDRARLAERVAHAISLERAVIAGLPPAEPGAEGLVDELAGHLRALLRDVLCGHLDADVRRIADEILIEAAATAVAV